MHLLELDFIDDVLACVLVSAHKVLWSGFNLDLSIVHDDVLEVVTHEAVKWRDLLRDQAMKSEVRSDDWPSFILVDFFIWEWDIILI
jgi:hypothetical protein